MPISLIDKIEPKNAAFTGLVDAKQILGDGATNTLPDDAVSESNVTQHEGALSISETQITGNTGWVPSGATWTYVSVDDPIGVIQESGDQTGKYWAGMRIRFTNNSNTVYGIIQVVALNSGNTRITFLHEIDPADSLALYLMQNSAITNPVYSWHKAPKNFPLRVSSWEVFFRDTLDRQLNGPVTGTWYNHGSSALTVPIGAWILGYDVVCDAESGGNNNKNIRTQVTLSKANNTEDDVNLTCNHQVGGALGSLRIAITQVKNREVVLSTKTTYYLNQAVIVGTLNSLAYRGVRMPTYIYARNVYL